MKYSKKKEWYITMYHSLYKLVVCFLQIEGFFDFVNVI